MARELCVRIWNDFFEQKLRTFQVDFVEISYSIYNNKKIRQKFWENCSKRSKIFKLANWEDFFNTWLNLLEILLLSNCKKEIENMKIFKIGKEYYKKFFFVQIRFEIRFWIIFYTIDLEKCQNMYILKISENKLNFKKCPLNFI